MSGENDLVADRIGWIGYIHEHAADPYFIQEPSEKTIPLLICCSANVYSSLLFFKSRYVLEGSKVAGQYLPPERPFPVHNGSLRKNPVCPGWGTNRTFR